MKALSQRVVKSCKTLSVSQSVFEFSEIKVYIYSIREDWPSLPTQSSLGIVRLTPSKPAGKAAWGCTVQQMSQPEGGGCSAQK